MKPIIRQCLDRLNETHQTIDSEGMVHMRAETAIMIQTWMEHLINAVDQLEQRNYELFEKYTSEIKKRSLDRYSLYDEQSREKTK